MRFSLLCLLYASYAAAYAPTSILHNTRLQDYTSATTLQAKTQTRPRAQNDSYSNRRRYYGNNDFDVSSEDSEAVSKLKSQVHYIKGQIVEANLRATAAERRVAILSREQNNDVKNKNAKLQQTEEKEKIAMKKEAGTLRNKIKKLESEMQQLQKSMDTQTNELWQVKLDLTSSKNENAELKNQTRAIQEKSEKQMEDMEKRNQREQATLTRVNISLRNELEEYKASYRAKLAKFNTDQQELKSSHVKEMDLLEAKLNGELLKLTQDYEKKKEQLIKEYEQQLYERDMSIAVYKGERRSVRKLGKLVWSLVKERTVNVFRRKRARANKSQNENEEMSLGTKEMGQPGT
uniref:Uncharacterized protein n=2 Tax=Ditylum brightwellii TaxID=49249 RepID=A0A7S1Z0U9_9STRA